jgi:hypothetical protein
VQVTRAHIGADYMALPAMPMIKAWQSHYVAKTSSGNNQNIILDIAIT